MQTSPEGVAIPYGMTKVSVGDAKHIWALDGNGSKYEWSSTTGWYNHVGALQDISVAADGTIWGLNSEGKLWQYIP